MQPRKRMKMCASCDGMVDLDVIVCPYCGADFAKNTQETAKQKTPPLEETLSALYPPPYKPKSFGSEQEEKAQMAEASLNADPLNPEKNVTDIPMSSQMNLSENVMGRSENISEQSSEVNRVDAKVEAAPLSEVEKEENRQKKTILSTLLFSLGVNLLLFSLFLLFFSTHGELFLRWDASYWYLYSLVGAGMLAGGYKLLGKLNSSS